MQLFDDELSDDQLDDGNILNLRHEFDGPTGQKVSYLVLVVSLQLFRRTVQMFREYEFNCFMDRLY
jgi:hypothetical protein